MVLRHQWWVYLTKQLQVPPVASRKASVQEESAVNKMLEWNKISITQLKKGGIEKSRLQKYALFWEYDNEVIILTTVF